MSILPSSALATKRSLSPAWRYATNAVSLISVLLFSGIIFGWAPLELMLLREGQYGELCSPDDDKCAARMNELNAMFTLAQFWLSFASLPVGFLLDMASKPLHFGVAGVLEIVGLLLMAVSDSRGHDWFLLGYSLLALGGCMTMLGAFPASFLLPRYQAGILASISCLFDASSIIFYLFFKLFEHWSISRQSLFLVWVLVAVVVYTALVFCWTHLERQDWKTVIEQEDNDEDEGDEEDSNANPDDNKPTDPHAGRLAALGIQDWPVPKQLATWEYGLAVLFASCQMLRCNFYIMTVDHFLESIGDVNAHYANIFSWILPCGIVFVPLIEATVTRLGVLNTLHVTNAIGFVFGILLWIPSLTPVQVSNFGLFTAFRAYLYSTLNTFIAVTFGVATMGRIIGFVFTTAAVISLVQYPLAVWTTVQQQGNFLPANVGLVALGLLPICASLAYDCVCRRDAKSETNSLLQQAGHDSYGSIGASASASPKRSSLVGGNTAFLLSSPGRRSLANVRLSRQENK